MGEVVINKAEDVLVLLLEKDDEGVVGRRGVHEVGRHVGHVRRCHAVSAGDVGDGGGEDSRDGFLAVTVMERVLSFEEKLHVSYLQYLE